VNPVILSLPYRTGLLPRKQSLLALLPRSKPGASWSNGVKMTDKNLPHPFKNVKYHNSPLKSFASLYRLQTSFSCPGSSNFLESIFNLLNPGLKYLNFPLQIKDLLFKKFSS